MYYAISALFEQIKLRKIYSVKAQSKKKNGVKKLQVIVYNKSFEQNVKYELIQEERLKFKCSCK